MLSCAGATLDGVDERGDSLIGDGLTVGSDMYLNEGFASAGTVNIRSARIGGSLSLMPAKLAGDAGTTALDARAAQIGHELRWEPLAPVSGRVILEDASAGSLRDSWVNEAGHADEAEDADAAEDAKLAREEAEERVTKSMSLRTPSTPTRAPAMRLTGPTPPMRRSWRDATATGHRLTRASFC